MGTQGYILLTLRVRQDDNRYVAECVELGTVSCGETIDEAFDNIKDACTVHLNSLEQLGERQRFFREHNIRIRHVRPESPRKVDITPDVFTATYLQAVPA